ncbi:membrane protein required for colicin V production [Fluviicoccus keumensis]|uniref:Membrane protein required for colicin V production n=1 Tax=Fluviicoccus keumensis TaxID=1435465 RepID=A0A4Q7ZD85_9GAMM|nr:CvpA family protein [Fluviicoccus keumensis]RZU48184.1 membrane protein required for colicin V production [Fluviicoccus keumensis]
MHPADILILAVVAFSIWKGFRRGLVREAIALAGWIIGLIMAVNSYQRVAPALAPFIETPSLRMAAAFVLICLSVVTVVFLIGQLVRSLLSALAMGPADHLMGGLFGLARGVLIVLLSVGLVSRFFQNDPWWREAELPRAALPYVPEALSLTDKLKAEMKHLPKIQIQTANPDH